VRVSKNTLKDFATGIRPQLGASCFLATNGYIAVPAQPFFDRDALALLGNSAAAGKVHDLLWLNVRPTRALVEFRQSALDLLDTILPQEACLTARSERYNPHFTLWVNEAEAKRNDPLPAVNWGEILPPAEVPCRIALGDCGPCGQIRRYTDNASRLDSFFKI